ncbi:Zinc finger C2H2 [Penicillium malachiteum]|uniref:Zinc finger C2H2 n=1 Tax=Penicillium malachiteum TaxID=1324776 RepID=UPI0025472C57|nr:Zinc finger C2H2 [Penicillium malachiteum]KAJ5714070.1 Zinc finger C2H2 [Penicillium malachiteum]
MASRDSPGSPLSSVGTADESDHESIRHESRAQSPSASSNMPPSKRRRTGVASWDRNTPLSSVHDDVPPPASPTASISSDSSGDIPNSPSLAGLLGNNVDEDYSGQSTDQVTVCQWDGCTVGDLSNMDGLVQHLHNEHIGSRQKRYSCEWIDCSRKGQTHASAYALRAHMRSHTREKPFYCTLPECDRNFTRSDALTKHMRSVHEIDSLRQAEAKAHAAANANSTPTVSIAPSVTGTPASKLQRIRLKLSHPHKDGEADHPDQIISMSAAPLPEPDVEDTMPELGPELGLEPHELAMPPRELYRLLRRQIHWAENEGSELRAEWELLQPRRERAWREKDAVFDDLIEAELKLFNVLIGDSDDANVNLMTSLERLQQQQVLFTRQQEDLRAKSVEMDVDDAAAV